MKETTLTPLLWKKIKHIDINADKTEIGFNTEEAYYRFIAVGDCCSSSWFEHFGGIEALLGHTPCEIIKHADHEATGAEKTAGTDVERVYSWTFITDYGRADLEMRNDSNGYYGGSILAYPGKVTGNKLLCDY